MWVRSIYIYVYVLVSENKKHFVKKNKYFVIGENMPVIPAKKYTF